MEETNEKTELGLTRNFIPIGKGQIPGGYSGDWRTVSFLWDMKSGKTIVWCDKVGYFTYQTPLAQDSQEAYWLLNNHPSSNARFVTSS